MPSTDSKTFNFSSLDASAFVRLPVVRELFGVCGATVYRWVDSGILPKPRKIGHRAVGWNVGELRAAQARICLG